MTLFRALSISVVVLLAASSAGAQERPNVVFILADDLGVDDLACYGRKDQPTPNLDRLAAGGARFTSAYCGLSICSASRAAIMTGKAPARVHLTTFLPGRPNARSQKLLHPEITLNLPSSEVTLAERFKAAGYATGIFGKWHLGDQAEYQPERRGFDETFVHGAGGIGQTYPGSCGDAPGNTYFDPAIRHNGTFEKTKGYCTDVFFDRALAWMDGRRKAGGPFFAYITPNAAHTPLQCPDDYAKRHAGEVPEDVAKFYGMIENIDEDFGRLLDALKSWGIEDDTLVVFLTDNGGTLGVKTFNAGMRGQKVTPYEGGTRVPSFWRWPAAIRGDRDVSALAAHVDVFPTLIDALGLRVDAPAREQVEGRSLAPFFRADSVEWPRRTLITHVGRWPRGKRDEFKFKGASIRDDRFALVNDVELYDLQADPGQATNVIDAHPDVVARLRAEYEAWWKAMLPGLVNEDAVGPKVNPYKEWYWRQFGGGPDA